jgi:branched-chain amino acid aminotransferase
MKAGADEALMLDVHGFVNTMNSCNFSLVETYGADGAS